ncbi:MAG: LytTR family DNA-binding domain-containing protein [Bacteroidota bacterium]
MRVLIVEDEAPAFRRLQKVLEEINPEIEIVDVLDSVEESIKWFESQPLPDLVFMDIQLSDGLSFEIFDAVTVNKPVIFTTAFDEYMLRAFKVNSVDYLLKPIKKEELAASLAKYENLRNAFGNGTQTSTPDLNALIRQIRLDDKKYKTRFLVKKGDELLSVETSDIAFFQMRNGVVHLTTNGNRHHIMDFNLDELTQQLDPERFYRANRQFIIHFPAIKKVHKYHKGKLLIELSYPTEEPVTVSSEKASDFKAWLGD